MSNRAEPSDAVLTDPTDRDPSPGGTDVWETTRQAASVPQAFDAVADTWPNRTAVEWDTGRWTYRELQSASRRIAQGLRSAGIAPGTTVAILGDRSAEACAAMLGILRAGAAYVPLDERLPTDRLRTMLDTAGIDVGVRLPGSSPTVPDRVTLMDVAGLSDGTRTIEPPEADVPPDLDRTAYVMFTSGSTGTPKAVAVRQRGVLRLATDNGFLELGPDDRVMHAASLSFDSSTLEIWPTLLAGACLVIVDQDLLLAPAALRDHVRAAAIDTVFLTTGVFHHVAQACPEVFDGLRYAMTGGEALNPALARRVVGRPRLLVNCYGPTEGTVMATFQVVAEADGQRSVPIGVPLPYVRCAVLRPDGSLVGPGEDGELHISGEGLAAGYLGDPDETERRFVHLGLEGAAPVRYYRTGDQARWDAAGRLEFRGRLDHQVKVRGFRIELAEVETALAALDGVGEAAVVAVDDATSRLLVAFCTAARPGDGPPEPSALRRSLATTLPSYMVPSTVVAIEAIPLTGSGKVDRQRLAARARALVTAADQPVVSTQDADEAVLSAWRETLSLDVVDPDGDFFALGGNSLMAARLIARVQASMSLDGSRGHELIRGLLSDPRPAAFAAVVDAVARRTADGSVPDGEDGQDRWWPDVRLHPRPDAVDRQPRDDARPDAVLLTGATGFFGSTLLHELVDRTDSTVHCLVRAADEAAALARLQAAQQKYGLPPVPAARVVAVPGDLTAHRLGLDDATWAGLASRIGRVYHSGAHVNFVYPYEWLRRTNVDGTRSLVELAEAGGGIPLHYVSTIAVLAGSGSAAVRQVAEDTPLDHVDRLSMGYPESKWVAEQILRSAASRGLPVVVHRPYEITGRTTDGRWNTEAAICAFFKAIVEMGCAPDIDLPLDFVPVDYLAATLVHLAETRRPEGQTYHLTNPRYALLGLMVERLRDHGHQIELVGYPTWLAALADFCAARPEHPIVSFLPIFTNVAASSSLTVKELYFEGTFPRFGRERTDEHLAGSGITCPPVDAEMLDAYIRWFHDVGYIARPRVGAATRA
ncbi:amino acid adenylation domain-containing SDR family oxidoreductase [Oerskovia enterophila]|uniref:amino acid adenylation domain-containing SDR family oxidoreductase n=1 Tax=Oerskovia enterophila TaxID=43678 RepID=UPI0033918672